MLVPFHSKALTGSALAEAIQPLCLWNCCQVAAADSAEFFARKRRLFICLLTGLLPPRMKRRQRQRQRKTSLLIPKLTCRLGEGVGGACQGATRGLAQLRLTSTATLAKAQVLLTLTGTSSSALTLLHAHTQGRSRAVAGKEGVRGETTTYGCPGLWMPPVPAPSHVPDS